MNVKMKFLTHFMHRRMEISTLFLKNESVFIENVMKIVFTQKMSLKI